MEEQENGMNPLYELRQVIRYHALLGISEYPVSPACLAKAAGGPDEGPIAPRQKPMLQESGGEKREAIPAESRLRTQPKTPEVNTGGRPAMAFDLPCCAACPVLAALSEEQAGRERRDLCVVGLGLGQEELGSDEAKDVSDLLFRMLEAIGLRRVDIAAFGLVPCMEMARAAEAAALQPFCRAVLRRQIEAVSARIVLAFGPEAAQLLLLTDKAVSALRGRRHEFDGRPLIVTYHPAFLLRQTELKKAAWEDLKIAKNILLRFAAPVTAG